MNYSFLLYVSIIFALIGIRNVYPGGKILLRQRKLRRSGVGINAVVTSCTLKRENEIMLRTCYQFHPVSGGEYHGEFISTEEYDVGAIIQIRYLPSDPRKNVVTDSLAFARKRFYSGLGCFAAGFILIGIFMYMSTMHHAPGVSGDYLTAQTFDDAQEEFPLPYGTDIAAFGEDLYIARGTQKDDDGQAAKKPGGITPKTGVLPSGPPDTPSLLAVLPVSVLTERIGMPDSMTWEADRLSCRIDGPYDYTDSDDLYVWAEFFEGTGDQYVKQCGMLGKKGANYLARGGSWSIPEGTVTFSDAQVDYSSNEWSVYMASWLGMPGGGVLAVCAKVEIILHYEGAEQPYGGNPREYFRETMKLFWDKVQVITEDFSSVTVPGPYAKRRIGSPNGAWAAHTAVGEWTPDSVENLALDEASVQYLTIISPGMINAVLEAWFEGIYVSTNIDQENDVIVGDRRISVFRVSGDKVVGHSNQYRSRVDYILSCMENDEYILAIITAEDTYTLDNVRELAEKIFLPASIETGMEDEESLMSPDRLEKVETVLKISPDAEGIGAARDDLSEEKYIIDQDADGKMTAAAVLSIPDWGAPESVMFSRWNEDTITVELQNFANQDDFTSVKDNDITRLYIEYSFMDENGAAVLASPDTKSFKAGGRQFHYTIGNKKGSSLFKYFTMWTKTSEGRYLRIMMDARTEKHCDPEVLFEGVPQKMAAMITIYADNFERITAAGPQALRRISLSESDDGELVVWAPVGRDAILYYGSISEIGIRDNYPAEMEIKRTYSFEPATANSVLPYAGIRYHSFDQQAHGTVTAGDFTAEYKVIGGFGNRWSEGKRLCSCCVAIPIGDKYYLAITINSTGRSMMEDPAEMLLGYMEKIEAEYTASDGTVTHFSGRG